MCVIRRSFCFYHCVSSYQFDLVLNLVKRNLTVRYKRSTIGLFWTMLNPIIMTAVYTVVFSTIFRFGTKDFVIYFLSAFLVWNFFAQSTSDASQCILGAGSLIKKIYIPKTLLVLSTVISNLVNMAFAMIPLIGLLLITGKGINLELLYLIPGLFLVTFFALGISFLLAALTVFFHDVGEVYRVLLSPWMFLTPIMYPMEIIPSQYSNLFKLNPMFHLIELFRIPIYESSAPDMTTLFLSALIAGIVAVSGYLVFTRLEDSFIYYV